MLTVPVYALDIIMHGCSAGRTLAPDVVDIVFGKMLIRKLVSEVLRNLPGRRTDFMHRSGWHLATALHVGTSGYIIIRSIIFPSADAIKTNVAHAIHADPETDDLVVLAVQKHRGRRRHQHLRNRMDRAAAEHIAGERLQLP